MFGSGQNESLVYVPELFLGSSSSSSQEPLSDFSTMQHDKPAQPILERYLASTSNERKFSAHYNKTYEWIKCSQNLNSMFCFACCHFFMGTLRVGKLLVKGLSLSQDFASGKTVLVY